MSDEKKEPMQILHRDLSTQNQVGVLLAVSQTMMQYLSREPEETENIPGQRPLPGESRLAAEATLIKACSRIDTIIDDTQRWGMDFQLALEKVFEDSHKLAGETAASQQKLHVVEIERAEAQKNAALEITSPHFRYKPELTEMPDGTWVAFLGDGDQIAGVGENPAAALRAFDMVFAGQLTEQAKQVATEREKQLNEIETLDSTGPGEAEVNDGGRENPGGVLGAPGPEHPGN